MVGATERSKERRDVVDALRIDCVDALRTVCTHAHTIERIVALIDSNIAVIGRRCG